jgi:lipid A 3-O-deacylase
VPLVELYNLHRGGRCRAQILSLATCVISGVFLGAPVGAKAQSQLPLTNMVTKSDGPSPAIWDGGVGDGFRSTAQSISLSAGATYGIAAFGSRQAHDLALVSVTYGHMLCSTLGNDHWYRGNVEFRIELFSGSQFSPETEWFVGLTPHLRYDFATGTRWVPFLDAGAGVTATGIGAPDLGGIFEFNLQPGLGVEWFIKDTMALTLECRYVHWSCAGISNPNLGLNAVAGMMGLTFYF